MLARAYPQASVHGYDFHDRSIQVARQHAGQAGLGGRIRFKPLDATVCPRALRRGRRRRVYPPFWSADADAAASRRWERTVRSTLSATIPMVNHQLSWEMALAATTAW